jgi:hypothetical protein
VKSQDGNRNGGQVGKEGGKEGGGGREGGSDAWEARPRSDKDVYEKIPSPLCCSPLKSPSLTILARVEHAARVGPGLSLLQSSHREEACLPQK